jgi:hypothetical protein
MDLNGQKIDSLIHKIGYPGEHIAGQLQFRGSHSRGE